MSLDTTGTGATPVWRLQRHGEVASTNDLAGALPPWHAVTAATQTSGRGRYRRAWVSDLGGIWLSAKLPTPGKPETWAILPLAAGWALREAIASLGVEQLRLRWPNDLMIGRAKLAGILVERFSADAAVVGIGINHSNDPAGADPGLQGQVLRLADLLSPLPSQEQIIALLLAHLAQAQALLASGHASDFLPELNRAWQIERVRVTLRGQPVPLEGRFLGVDLEGNLLLLADDNTRHCLSPLAVELLRELWQES